MDAIIKKLLAAMRTSEFWALVGQAYVETMNVQVPDEVKAMAWVYIVLRVASKVAQYVFPNPTTPNGGWFKADSPK